MRARMSRGDIAFFGLVAILLGAIFFGLLPTSRSYGSGNSSHPSHATANSSLNVITTENAHPGTNGWQIPSGQQATTQIQAYASATSVSPGQKLTFYVSTQQEGTSYSLAIYRLGWYGGQGGRLMMTQGNVIGHVQGYYDAASHRLVNCISCNVEPSVGLVEAKWHPSYTLTVPSDWVTGVYLTKFIDSAGLQTYVPFDMKGNSRATYVAVTSNTTYAAYNDWGGYSLYQAYSSFGIGSLGRGVKISLDRPYVQGYGSGHVLNFETDAIHWLERQGYDLSYVSSVDLHEDPAQLLQHHAYLSLGHDEYWSKEMRDGVEYARDHGIGLAFLGANTAYWQIRFGPDSMGVIDRTIVCYKVQSGHNDLAHDPLYGKDNGRVTTQWRDPLLSRPENALIGIMYSSLGDPGHQQSFQWQVSSSVHTSLLDGTGLRLGQRYGCSLVGYEWDHVFSNGATPSGLQVLGTSPTVDKNNNPDVSNTTYYIASSGAMVFATGSIYWTAALDSYRLFTDKGCTGQSLLIPGMQKLMEHVMDALVTHHTQGS